LNATIAEPTKKPEAPTFTDHFSQVAGPYGRFRPTYPAALFEHLGGLARRDAFVWEVAAGSGQATAGLARTFRRIVATDASHAQLAQMSLGGRVRRVVCLAEAPPLRDASQDLVAIAQALHWVDLERFFGAVRRVAKPGAVLAAWTYRLPELPDGLGSLIERFAHHDLGAFWPPERDHVENGYAGITFPFEEMPAPDFRVDARMDIDAFLGYVRTWSAVTRARAATGSDPVDAFEPEWRALWGAERVRPVSWPVTLRTFRVREPG
jgi:SAM-dependent methyltransferase